MAALLYHKIHLPLSGVLPEENLAVAVQSPFAEGDGNQVLRQSPQVRGELAGSGGDEAVVDAVNLAVGPGLLPRLEGKARERKKQKRLLKIPDVLGDGVSAFAPSHGGQPVQGVFPGDIGQKVGGKVLNAGDGADLAAAHDVLVENRVPQGSEVEALIQVLQCGFRKPAAPDIGAQRLGNFRLGRRRAESQQAFAERKGEKPEGQVPAGKVSG